MIAISIPTTIYTIAIARIKKIAIRKKVKEINFPFSFG
jgi:hypothetical protein